MNMSPEELASDARKSQNAQIRKEALKESERGQHLKKVGGCYQPPCPVRHPHAGDCAIFILTEDDAHSCCFRMTEGEEQGLLFRRLFG